MALRHWYLVPNGSAELSGLIYPISSFLLDILALVGDSNALSRNVEEKNTHWRGVILQKNENFSHTATKTLKLAILS